ncbi:hypothetical protein GCM10027449_15780 [Sinomonas notoginsengisoli]|uniref:hypothetical protein n=1 Tax=Sinomonas notoginsengisoli TaxID=1457311 RepID=UPI001F48FAFB|nr:hypothetical protein [Sinomonas notoginsengisoli]
MRVTRRMRYAAASAVAAAALIGGGAAVANAATTPNPSATSGTSSAGAQLGGQHTAASADETAKVTAAVAAKDANAKVTQVEKDTDGSFDATATSNGSTVRYEVGADYQTVTADDHAGRGGGQRTPLSSDELAKATAAIKAKDANATVEDSWKDADGSFDVVVTSGSTRTKYEVSADYTSATADSGFGQGGGRHGHDGTAPSSAPSGTTQG